ncbi:MAG: MAPEG family protein [Pseudomonadota bacterium]
MAIELEMLGYAILLGFVQVMLYSVPGIAQLGMGYALSPRDEGKQIGGMAGRLQRAFYNYLETLPMFIGAVYVARSNGALTEMTALGSQIYLWARVAYVPAYAFGIPVLRTLIWMASIVGIFMVLLPALF